MSAITVLDRLGTIGRRPWVRGTGDQSVTRDGLLPLGAADGVRSAWPAGDTGQSTTEYAFVLVVVAVIGLALYAVGPEKIQALFSSIVDKLSGDAQSKVKLRVP